MLGWDFLLYELCLVPFKISTLSLILFLWRDDILTWAVCLTCIMLYGLLHIITVRWYGESEFWLASGKVLLIGIVFMFTFITSKHRFCDKIPGVFFGGNLEHNAYGFRYCYKPGSYFSCRMSWSILLWFRMGHRSDRCQCFGKRYISLQ
jgi:amino acid transporter